MDKTAVSLLNNFFTGFKKWVFDCQWSVIQNA